MSDTKPDEQREGQVLEFSGKPSAFVSPSMLAVALRNGWQVTPERKQKYFAAMDKAIDEIHLAPPERRAIIAAQCTRVLVAEQGQQLRDIHHTEHMQHEDGILDLRLRRADEGKPSEIIGIQIAPSEELPLPPSLAGYRLKGMLPAPGKN